MATGEFIGNKIADKIVKSRPVSGANSKNIKEIVIPPEKKTRNIKHLIRLTSGNKMNQSKWFFRQPIFC